jgi:hypothetical protein
MRKALTATTLALAIAGGAFLATHHAVYGNCHQSPDGYTCTLLRYEGNK